MKKLLTSSSTQLLTLAALGLLMSLGAFWHHSSNLTQLNKLGLLTQGVTTCWGRVSQTFTAIMIKDVQSAYLNRGFMGLSDECLSETVKETDSVKRDLGKGFENLNSLISEVNWFHEMVLKIHSPMLSGKGEATSLAPLMERFSKMENYKISFLDDVDSSMAKIRQVVRSDEVLLGSGFILLILSLSVLALKEFDRTQSKKTIENEALNLLSSGQGNVGAMVDTLIDKALVNQEFKITAQIFKDYHGDLLELLSHRQHSHKNSNHQESLPKENQLVEKKLDQDQVTTYAPRVSLKEIMVSVQNIHSSEVLQMSDVRDVQIEIEYEACEQIVSTVLNKLLEKRVNTKKVMMNNQVHSDRTILNFFLAGNTFNASELEFIDSEKTAVTDSQDMNLVILKELAQETETGLFFENKMDKNGKILGMNVRLVLKRSQREKSKLISVIKGKKKDLTRELMN